MQLKITPEHYEHLQKVITPLDTRARRTAYKAAGLTAMRYRWDLLRMATTTPYTPPMKWVCDNLYPYLDDTHIDSALRKILGMGHSSRIEPMWARNTELTGDKV